MIFFWNFGKKIASANLRQTFSGAIRYISVKTVIKRQRKNFIKFSFPFLRFDFDQVRRFSVTQKQILVTSFNRSIERRRIHDG